MFEIGQEVQCIKSDWWILVDNKKIPDNGPKVGDILTIVRMKEKWGEIYLGFREYGNNGFTQKHFRAIQRKKTDISIFTAMLKTQKTKVRA